MLSRPVTPWISRPPHLLHLSILGDLPSGFSIIDSMMHFRLFILIIFAISVAATPIHVRQDYIAGLLRALNQTNTTTLSYVLEQYFTTDQGQEIASSLSKGKHTLLAPTNSAMDPVVLKEEPDTLRTILSYHFINGSYPASSIASPRTHSIARTYLTNESYVNLGGSPQVQVLEQTPGGKGVLARQTTGNGTVIKSTTYQNLILHVINTVLTPPGDLKDALSSRLVGRAPNGLAQLDESLQNVGLRDSWNSQAKITVFAPIDEAFAAIESTISSLSNDQLSLILRNHVLSNNVVYSGGFDSRSTVTAVSGAELNLATENGVLYVIYKQVRARVLRSDVTLKNGVVHVIDAVLA